ncbi:MAG TPA: hypothetical protein VF083_07655, partial [Acidimicrobiia bacterium]
SLRIEVALETGSTVEIRLGSEDMPVDPAPVEGVNEWTVRIPEPSQPLIVSVCAADRRCALYWANTYSG